MKLAIISLYSDKDQKHQNIGGVASYTKNLVEHLPSSKTDDISILTAHEHIQASYTTNNIVVLKTFHKDIRYVWEIIAQVQKLKPDLIHIQHEVALFGGVLTTFLFPFLCLILKILGNKVVITLHGVMNLETMTKTFIRTNNALGPRQIMQHVPVWFIRRVLFHLYRQITAHVDRVIVHEQVFQDILHNQYRIPRQKIVVIAHGVEDLVQIPKQKARTQLGIEQKSHVCLFMGYYTGYKGLDTLVDGFSVYAKNDPQSMLLIGAGKHPKLGNNKAYQQSYRSLQKKAQSLLPANQYIWKGFIPEEEIPLYYSAADVVLFPYTSALAASGPMSLALGYATPFLVSDAFHDVFPDMPEIIFPNTQTGIAHALNTFFQAEKKIDYENLRKKRLWNTVARDTYQLYLELVTR